MKPLPAILENPGFADIDRHFAEFISGHGGGEIAAHAAAALSRNVRLGHICLELSSLPEPPGGWEAALKKNRATGAPEEGKPLVLDSAGRLYLRRYWEYEQSLARHVMERCGNSRGVADDGGDQQALAVETALARRFVVISGGPGTGKTTTVLKILSRLLAEPGNENLRIALAAPTGKAAARLEEAVRAGGAEHPAMPQSASTLHRLLGSRPGTATFRHHAGNPLPVDVVVVDEASMVPFTLMAKLFDALPAQARIILLGDPYQLASVEPGAVLGDIAAAAVKGSPLEGSIVTLRKNYRFGGESTIYALSSAVREGDAKRVFEIIGEGSKSDFVSAATPAVPQLAEELRSRILAGYSAYLKESDPAAALEKFRQFRVLCALRSGPYGVENVNRVIGAILRAEGLIPAAQPMRGVPVLVTRNDYEARLFNGDIGVILPDDAGVLQAWFADEAGGMRRIATARLPEYEPAFAMTVHKSQGSEYDNVLLILPPTPSPVCTRELVYTGLTRARKGVELWYREASLRAAVDTPAVRVSGLGDALRGKSAE